MKLLAVTCAIALVMSLLAKRVCAHEDRIYFLTEGNVSAYYRVGWDQFGTSQKMSILLQYLNDMQRQKGNMTKIQLYFNHDYTQSDQEYFTLGYGSFDAFNYPNGANDGVHGLKLGALTRRVSFRNILNLVSWALDNISYVERSQSAVKYKPRYEDTGTATSLPMTELMLYSASDDSVVTLLLTKKKYPRLQFSNSDIGYFFQNDLYHVYLTNDSTKPILSLQYIHEIVGSFNDGYFIFSNDSTFYYCAINYNDNSSKTKGPFIVQNVKAGRPPIVKYDNEFLYEDSVSYKFTEWFTLTFDNYRRTTKALFVPSLDLLVSDFDKNQDEIVRNLISNKTVKPIKTSENKIGPILTVLLILSFILNVWLIARRIKG